jgi:protein gp37
MAHQTAIEWTATYLPEGSQVLWKGEYTNVIPGATFNPWWGCQKVSPACKFCYAEHLSDVRLGKNLWGQQASRQLFGLKHWIEPLRWNAECARLGIMRKVFCASMADVFEDHPEVLEARQQLFQTIEKTPNLLWLLLTKRPENILSMIPEHWRWNKTIPNVMYGTTVESQRYAKQRVPPLLNVKKITGAKVFLSCEPLLGEVDLTVISMKMPVPENVPVPLYGRQGWLDALNGTFVHPTASYDSEWLDWVIAGGESGKDARPTHPNHFRVLRDQCKAAEVPFFFKQWGEWRPWDYPAEQISPKDWGTFNDMEPHLTDYPKDAFIRSLLHAPVGTKMALVGKKNAGRMLDGQYYNETPVWP